jgi:hypothetical protein
MGASDRAGYGDTGEGKLCSCPKLRVQDPLPAVGQSFGGVYLLNDVGDKLVTKGKARHIDLKEFGKTDCSPLSVLEWEKTVVGD